MDPALGLGKRLCEIFHYVAFDPYGQRMLALGFSKNYVSR